MAGLGFWVFGCSLPGSLSRRSCSQRAAYGWRIACCQTRWDRRTILPLSPLLTCVGLVFGALLGFRVVIAWEEFSSAEFNVSHEASALTIMYPQTVGMPAAEQTEKEHW